MPSRVQIARVVSSFAFILILVSCSPSNSGNGPGPLNGGANGPPVPKNVSAKLLKDTNELRVTWECPNGGAGYEVFRANASGGITQLTGSGISETEYQDVTYPVGQAVSYKVRSVLGDQVSEYSEMSAPLTVQIQDLPVANARASVLNFKDKIRISWSPITQDGVTPVYTVRRFLSKGNTEPDESIADQTYFKTDQDSTLYYDDQKEDADKAYYYKVDWVDSSSGTSGAAGKFVFGLRSYSDDANYEPNDSITQAKDISSGLPAGTTLTIYRFEDAGEVNQDTDWYKYHGAPQLVNVTVSLAADWPPSDKLELDFYYNGSPTYGDVSPGAGSKLYSFEPSDFGASPPPIVDLYFKIIPKGTNMIGTYTLSVSNGY